MILYVPEEKRDISDSEESYSSDEDMNGANHRIVFLKTIKSLCVNPTNYLSEWRVSHENYQPTIEYPHTGQEYDWFCSCSIRLSNHYRCICKQHICNTVSLKNVLNGKVIWVGQECAKQYLKIRKSENTCLECYKYHRKNKYNLCKVCQSKYILTIGDTHNGKTFHEIYKNFPSYIDWVKSLRFPGDKLRIFQKWIKENEKK
jgi:hypothetical protein